MPSYVRLIVVLMAAACALAAAPASAFAADPPAQESRHLLSRWRQVRDMVSKGAVPADQRREAAMVLAWGQPLQDLEANDDAELMELVKERLGSVDFVRQQLSQALADLDAAGDSFAARRGAFLAAFVSAADDSGQIYRLYVPPDYDPAHQYPLEVRPACYLDYQKVIQPERPLDRLVIGCGGRGQNGIEGLAELDALEAIRDVRRYYNVDPDRIYLTGGSIGGGGVWRLASRYPDLFAAATVDYGWTWTSTLYLENVSNLPMWVYHDTVDTWVPADESRTAFQFLSDLASPILYLETSGAGHSGKMKDPSWDASAWLLHQRRERSPNRVLYTTSTSARGRSYWLEIVAFQAPNALATVRAHVRRDGEQTQLFLHLENVEVVRVDLPEPLFPAGKSLSITTGGAPVVVPPPLPAHVYLRQQGDPSRGGVLSVSQRDPREPVAFRPYAAGGLNWMYTSGEPLMIVRGTGGTDRELVNAIARFCKLLSRRNTGWWPFTMEPFMLGRIPVKTDLEVTPEDIQRCNLIIVGPASTNRLLQRIAARLPAVEEDGILRIGPEQCDLEGKGYGLLHYNPEAPQRLIMVMSSPEVNFYKSVANGVADRMGDERPLGLVLRQLDPPRLVREIAWDKEWRVPEEALAPPRLPETFGANGWEVQAVHNRALRAATGADFAVYWRPEAEKADRAYRWDVSQARWRDLAAEIGQPATFFVGSATGADLLKLARPATANLAVDPVVDSAAIAPAARYRICMAPNIPKWFVIETGHPVDGASAVRLDLFQEVRRLMTGPRPQAPRLPAALLSPGGP